MSKARITLICADMSRNAFGRAYVLARVLHRSYQVKVVGAQFGRGVWAPMAGLLEAEGIEVRSIPASHHPRFLGAASKLWRAVDDSDLIYALKPYPTSFGLALAYQQAKHVPVMLDIDDWELGTLHAMSRQQRWKLYARGALSPNHLLLVRWLYGRVRRAEGITVSSRFLQEKYGGVVVPHGRDTRVMDPATVSGEAVRREFGLAGPVVMFFGTPRPHKGIEDLIAAVAQLQRPDVSCVIVGANMADKYDASLGQGSAQVRLLPMQPFARVPEFMAAADVVVIPQRQTPFSEAQMPAKIYDAMAMARPIVGTQISDIPETLAGCGLVVPPGDVGALAGAIGRLLDDPAEARRLGLAARAKCEAQYSWDAMQATLESLIATLLKR